MSHPGGTALGIAAAIRGGRLSAARLAAQTLDAIEQRDGAYNCFTAITAERALREAGEVDRAAAEGRDPGPLAGVPYAVKIGMLIGAQAFQEPPKSHAPAIVLAFLPQIAAWGKLRSWGFPGRRHRRARDHAREVVRTRRGALFSWHTHLILLAYSPPLRDNARGYASPDASAAIGLAWRQTCPRKA